MGRSFIAVGLVILCTGCAEFRLNREPQIHQFPPLPSTARQQDVAYSLTSSDPAIAAKLPEALMESGYFGSIHQGCQTNLLFIDATIYREGPSPLSYVFAFLTGYTLFILPSWGTSIVNLSVRVTSPQGRARIYTYSDGSREVLGLIVLPFMFSDPYKFSSTVLYDVAKNMFKCLVVDIRNDGFLDVNSDVIREGAPLATQLPVSSGVHSSTHADTAAEQLKKLKELKDAGILTDDEYEVRRKALVDKL